MHHLGMGHKYFLGSNRPWENRLRVKCYHRPQAKFQSPATEADEENNIKANKKGEKRREYRMKKLLFSIEDVDESEDKANEKGVIRKVFDASLKFLSKRKENYNKSENCFLSGKPAQNTTCKERKRSVYWKMEKTKRYKTADKSTTKRKRYKSKYKISRSAEQLDLSDS